MVWGRQRMWCCRNPEDGVGPECSRNRKMSGWLEDKAEHTKVREEVGAAGPLGSLWGLWFFLWKNRWTQANKSTILFWIFWMKLLSSPQTHIYLFLEEEGLSRASVSSCLYLRLSPESPWSNRPQFYTSCSFHKTMDHSASQAHRNSLTEK